MSFSSQNTSTVRAKLQREGKQRETGRITTITSGRTTCAHSFSPYQPSLWNFQHLSQCSVCTHLGKYQFLIITSRLGWCTKGGKKNPPKCTDSSHKKLTLEGRKVSRMTLSFTQGGKPGLWGRGMSLILSKFGCLWYLREIKSKKNHISGVSNDSSGSKWLSQEREPIVISSDPALSPAGNPDYPNPSISPVVFLQTAKTFQHLYVNGVLIECNHTGLFVATFAHLAETEKMQQRTGAHKV